MAGRSHAAALKRIVISGDAVKDKLHGESREYDTHYARDDMQLAFANPPEGGSFTSLERGLFPSTLQPLCRRCRCATRRVVGRS
jgi:hypothetical protein